MTLPKTFDYDEAHDESIITGPVAGVTGFEIHWIGLDINNKKIQIAVNEGVLAGDGNGLDFTARQEQIVLEDQDAIDFYTANQAIIDPLLIAAMEKWALDNGKTGTINT